MKKTWLEQLLGSKEDRAWREWVERPKPGVGIDGKPETCECGLCIEMRSDSIREVFGVLYGQEHIKQRAPATLIICNNCGRQSCQRVQDHNLPCGEPT
jgi:hypothetical protein